MSRVSYGGGGKKGGTICPQAEVSPNFLSDVFPTWRKYPQTWKKTHILGTQSTYVRTWKTEDLVL